MLFLSIPGPKVIAAPFFISFLLAVLGVPLCSVAQTVCLDETKILTSGGEVLDEVGLAVAVDGDIAIDPGARCFPTHWSVESS